MPRPVFIRNKKSGEEYQLDSVSDFNHRKARTNADGDLVTYADDGFEIVSYVDGSPYEPPARHEAPARDEPKKSD